MLVYAAMTRIRREALEHALGRIKKTAIAKQLRFIPKCNETPQEDSAMLSARGNSH